MHVYHCLIELRNDARALAFAAAADHWLGYLEAQGLIAGWRLLRRTMGLASGSHADFILELDIGGLTALDRALSVLGGADEESARRYDQMHQMIARAEIGLYRPFPDMAGRERIALI